jgi:hypothetical protein
LKKLLSKVNAPALETCDCPSSGVAKNRNQQEFLALAARLRDEANPQKANRLGDQLGRIIFGC